eukprot:scaffold1313_cov138-Isochrysis_galbana.AAC.6
MGAADAVRGAVIESPVRTRRDRLVPRSDDGAGDSAAPRRASSFCRAQSAPSRNSSRARV